MNHRYALAMTMWPDHNPKPLSGAQVPSSTITSLDDPWRSAAFKVLLAVALLDPLIIVIVLFSIGIIWWVVAMVAACGFLIPILVLWMIVTVGWNPAARNYPSQPILPGAVSKEWQSFGFSPWRRFNNCTTIVADERHLHVTPMALLRIFGAQTASLPFDRMNDLNTIMGGLLMSANLDGRRIYGPTWCMNLAMPPEKQE